MSSSDTFTYEEFLAAQRRMKRRRIIAIVWAVVIVLGLSMIITANCLQGSGQGYQSMGSFAVDSAGRLYVGFDEDILVYEDGEFLYEFTGLPELKNITPANLLFTIEDDLLLLSTGTQTHTVDLQGSILSTADEGSDKVVPDDVFTAANGDVYVRENILGRSEIIKNGSERVFQMPMMTFVIRTLWMAAFGFIFAGTTGLVCTLGPATFLGGRQIISRAG